VDGGCGGKQSHDTDVHSGSSNTTDSTSDDQGVHGRRASTERTPNFKERDAENVRPFGLKLPVDLSPYQVCGCGADQEGYAEPGQFGDGVEVLHDDWLDIGYDGVVEGEEEGGREDGEDDHDPSPALDVARGLFCYGLGWLFLRIDFAVDRSVLGGIEGLLLFRAQHVIGCC